MLFHGVVQGRGYLARDAAPDLVELQAGDVIVVTQGEPHRLVSDASVRPVPISSLPTTSGPVPIVTGGSGGDPTVIVCGTFELDHPAASSIVGLLPPLLHGRPEGKARAKWASATLELLDGELDAPQGSAVVTSLADSLFVHALNCAARSHASPASSLLAAARDEHIGRALALVHGNPSREWPVGDLAREVGMSRTRFFDRFSALVGEPPARYIARWRVHVAADLLRTQSLSTAVVAERVGYASEDAFARAFRRHAGVSPREYRLQREGVARA